MITATPHFLHCIWCAGYFAEAPNRDQIEAKERRKASAPSVCPSCPSCLSSLPSMSALRSGSLGFIGVDTAARAGLAKETCEETHERIDGETREGQKEDALWQRCPICHKAIVSHLISKEYSALDVHIHHTCEEQKQKLLLCHKQEELLYRTPEPFPAGDWDGQTDREMLARPKQREEQAAGLCERFGLDAWYPDSVDCDALFWYNHSLYQGGPTSVKALEYQG